MANHEIIRLSAELQDPGYSLTSFEALGLDLDANELDKFCAMVDSSSGSEAALKVVEHIDKVDMTIIQDERCMKLGSSIIAPAVELLFNGNEDADDEWALFGINKYMAGAHFGPHVDNVGKSVLVITVKGERVFNILEKIPDDKEIEGYSFGEVLDSFVLKTGSIMILDRDTDPGHAVGNTISDSISIVADAPGVIRGS